MIIEEGFKAYSFTQYPFTEDEWEVFNKDTLSKIRFTAGAQWAISALMDKNLAVAVKALKEINQANDCPHKFNLEIHNILVNVLKEIGS